MPGQFDSEAEMDKDQEEEQQHASINILYEAMYQLTVEPGRFDSIARKLTQDLNVVLEGMVSTCDGMQYIIICRTVFWSILHVILCRLRPA